jgi:hypothetical protein
MEAKPWELSGARVWSPPNAVKELFGEFLTTYLSKTCEKLLGFVRLSSHFLRVAFHRRFHTCEPPSDSPYASS